MSAFALPQTTTIPMGCPKCHQDLRYDVAEQKYSCVCGYSRPSLTVDPRDLVVVATNGHAADRDPDELVSLPTLCAEWGQGKNAVLFRLRRAEAPLLDREGKPSAGGTGHPLFVRRADAERARAKPPGRVWGQSPAQKSEAAAKPATSTALALATAQPPASVDVIAPPATDLRPSGAAAPAKVRYVAKVVDPGRPGRLRLALEHVARLTEVADEEANVGAIDALVRYALAVDAQDGGAS